MTETRKIVVLAGDGIGPEIVGATREVLDAVGSFEYEEHLIGGASIDRHGVALTDEVIEACKASDAVLLGAVGGPKWDEAVAKDPTAPRPEQGLLGIRKALGLYANLRPAKTVKGVQAAFSDIDLVVVRENLEGMYSGIEFDAGTPEAAEVIEKINSLSKKKVDAEAALSIKVITERNTRNIVKFAFEYARANGRKKVTIVHKANIMKFTEGLFLRVGQEVAAEYPDIECNDRIVDNMCMQLMQKPGEYDVLVMENLFGDVVSDLTAGMIGGLGVAPGGNIGSNGAVFEPIHGSAPSHAGKNEANPTAMILSGAMMLRYLGEQGQAIRVETAVADVIAKGDRVTYDLRADRDPSRAAGTSGMADAIIEAMG